MPSLATDIIYVGIFIFISCHKIAVRDKIVHLRTIDCVGECFSISHNRILIAGQEGDSLTNQIHKRRFFLIGEIGVEVCRCTVSRIVVCWFVNRGASHKK